MEREKSEVMEWKKSEVMEWEKPEIIVLADDDDTYGDSCISGSAA
jgi:hypothetical protein